MERDIDELIVGLQRFRERLDTGGSLSVQKLFVNSDSSAKQSPDDEKLYKKCIETVEALDGIQQALTPPLHTLVDAFFGFINSKALLCAVEYDIAGALADGPKTAEQLAASTTPPLSSLRLHQVMQMLTGIGVFNYDSASAKYRGNAVSDLIKTDHWTQWVLWAKLYPTEFYDMMRFLPQHLEKDAHRTAAQMNYDTDRSFYEYLATSGLSSVFHKTLGAGATAQLPGMLSDYPWEEVQDEVVLDLGAGSGELLVRLMRAHPKMRGSFMDIPDTMERLLPSFAPGGKYADLIHRVQDFHSGDFLKEVPPASVYTIKWCLHNWSDEDTITILKNVRRAMVVTPAARLLIIESVADSSRMGRPAKYGDIIMMATVNGKERDEKQWSSVCRTAGWRLHKIWPLRNSIPVCIDLRPE